MVSPDQDGLSFHQALACDTLTSYRIFNVDTRRKESCIGKKKGRKNHPSILGPSHHYVTSAGAREHQAYISLTQPVPLHKPSSCSFSSAAWRSSTAFSTSSSRKSSYPSRLSWMWFLNLMMSSNIRSISV